MIRCTLAALVVIAGCGNDDDGDRDAVPADCNYLARVAIEARAGGVHDDGAVTIYGAIRFAPVVGEPELSSERTVNAVYVAGQGVVPAADAFNFRAWTIDIAADRIAAFTTTDDDGTKRAALPVRAYLQDGCVLDLPAADQPLILLPEDES
jgi:hypothetical protein